MKMTMMEKTLIVINSIIGLTIIISVILDMTSLKDTVNMYCLITLIAEVAICAICLILNAILKYHKKNKFFKKHETLA